MTTVTPTTRIPITVTYSTGRIQTVRRTPAFVARLMREVSTQQRPGIALVLVDAR